MWCLDCLEGRAYWVSTSTFNLHFRKEKYSPERLAGRVAHTVFFSSFSYYLRVVVWSKQRTAITGIKTLSCPLYCRSSKGGWRVNLLVFCQLSSPCFHAGKVFSWLILPRLYSSTDFRIWPKVNNYNLQYGFSGMDNMAINLRLHWVTWSKKESKAKRGCGDEGQRESTIVNTSY